jgi:hypothetical protein
VCGGLWEEDEEIIAVKVEHKKKKKKKKKKLLMGFSLCICCCLAVLYTRCMIFPFIAVYYLVVDMYVPAIFFVFILLWVLCPNISRQTSSSLARGRGNTTK